MLATVGLIFQQIYTTACGHDYWTKLTVWTKKIFGSAIEPIIMQFAMLYTIDRDDYLLSSDFWYLIVRSRGKLNTRHERDNSEMKWTKIVGGFLECLDWLIEVVQLEDFVDGQFDDIDTQMSTLSTFKVNDPTVTNLY